MNLVDIIKDQLTSQMTSKLASLVGGSEDQTKTALGAAVPALLSAFSGMSSAGGSNADKLASAVNSFDVGSLGKMAGLLDNEPEKALDQGSSLLGSLFGGSSLSGLLGVLAKFGAFSPDNLKKLLAYASPLVMGAIAKQFQGKQATPQGLASLFADQKDNIAAAMPAGLSLADVPGLADVRKDVRQTADRVSATTQRTAHAAADTGSSLMSTLLPLGALALLGLLAWNFFGRDREEPAATQVAETNTDIETRKPVVETPAEEIAAAPEVIDEVPKLDLSQYTSKLGSVYTTATETLNGITDAASAEAAKPTLEGLGAEVDALAAQRRNFPEEARMSIGKVASENIGPLRQLVEKVLAIPGVKEAIGPVLNGMVTKLAGFSG